MRLDEIRKRLEAATKWPWHVDARASTRVVDDFDTTVASAGMASRELADSQANARFVAAAPDDISYLLARVEKLEGLLTRLVAANAQTKTWEDFGIHAARVAAEARTLLAERRASR